MEYDLVVVENKVIDIGDFSSLIFASQVDKEIIELENGDKIERLFVNIEKEKIIGLLHERGIVSGTAEHSMKSYIENMKNELENVQEWADEEYLKQREVIFMENNTIDKWINEVKKLINLKAKSPYQILMIDMNYEEYLFEELKEISPFQKFLLKIDLDYIIEISIAETLYNIPFLSQEEYLYEIISTYPSKTLIKIDVTERCNAKISKMREKWKIKRNSIYFARVKDDYDSIVEKIDLYEQDQIVKELLIVHAITLFESYLKNITKFAIGNNSMFLRKLLEEDNRFSDKNQNFTYKELFSKLTSLKMEVFQYVNKESFQNMETIHTYLIKIFNVYENKEEFSLFKGEYISMLKKRNTIVHNSGFGIDGCKVEISSDDLKKSYNIIFNAIKNIDSKVYFNILI